MLIYIFHRDFRTIDNQALNECINESKKIKEPIYPVFFFDPRQITMENSYRSIASIRFMLEGLTDLKKSIPELELFYGKPEEILKKYYSNATVYHMADYTPFAKRRHKAFVNVVSKCVEVDNVFLNNEIINIENKVFTYFKREAEDYEILMPSTKRGTFNKITHQNSKMKRHQVQIKLALKGAYKIVYRDGSIEFDNDQDIEIHGTRTNALTIMRNIPDTQKKYANDRDILQHQTTHLSAYIKFGLVSIREVYNNGLRIKSVKDREAFINQLYWNNFYFNHQIKYNIMVHPLKFRPTLEWDNKAAWWQKWKTATTGIPIVDACMTQLNKTGYLHNRGRLIVANVLSHWFMINWRKGEKYFAQMLVDYDPVQNNGNWAFTASMGADYQVRIYNPFTQGSRYDSAAKYIKHWLPNLEHIPAKQIHQWYRYYNRYDLDEIHYYRPLVWNPSKRFKEVRKIYQDAPPETDTKQTKDKKPKKNK